MMYNRFMANHNLYTITDSVVTRLTPNGTHSGMDITLQNVSSSGYIYIGGSNVSSINYGYRLLPNQAISFELPPKDHLFAIASDTEVKLARLDIGLESQN